MINILYKKRISTVHKSFTCVFYSRFTQNLSLLIKDINDTLKGPYASVNSVNDMMSL